MARTKKVESATQQTAVVETKAKEEVVTKPVEKKYERLASIDRFRGFAVFCMVFFQLIAKFDSFGVFTKIANHDQGVGLSMDPIFSGLNYADVIAPMFMFAIGLSYIFSFKRRMERDGKVKTYLHFATRYLGLIGLGAFMSGVEWLLEVIMDGTTPSGFVTFIFVLMGIFAVAGIGYLITLIPKLSKAKKYFGMVAGYTLAFIGLATLILTAKEFALLNAGVQFTREASWDVLQAIGFAGLISLLVMGKSPWKRLLWAIGIFVGFMLYFEFNTAVAKTVVQGGFSGGFGWSVLIIAGSVISEFMTKNKKSIYIALGVTAALALVSRFTLDISFRGVSAGYVLTTLAISTLVFTVFTLFDFLKLPKGDYLAWWGSNPLLLFIMQFFLIYGANELLPNEAFGQAPVWLAIIWTVIFTSLFSFIAWWLARKKRVIKL